MYMHYIAHTSALHLSTAVGHAVAIADRAVIELIRTECADTVAPDGGMWRDTAPLLNEHEYAAATIDQHRQVLDYARLRGLVFVHPLHAHLVRLLRDE